MSAEDVVAEALATGIEWGEDVGATPEEMARIAVAALRQAGLIDGGESSE